jgi:hypothetical protein
MKMISYNIMAIAFLVFSGWIAWIEGPWGWPAVAAFFLSIVPTTQEVKQEDSKPGLNEEEQGLINVLRKQFKRREDKDV